MNTISASRVAFGKRVKDQRETIGMTMEELASLMGYKHRSSINKLETGENSINQERVKDLAIYLKTNVAYLMGWGDGIRDLTQDEFDLILYYRGATPDGRAMALGELKASQKSITSVG